MAVHIRVLDENGGLVTEGLVVRFPARFGRESDNEVPFDPVRFKYVSKIHVVLHWVDDRLFVSHRSGTNKTLLNNELIGDVPKPVVAGDRIRLGLRGPTVEIVSTNHPGVPQVPATQSEPVIAGPSSPAAPAAPAAPAFASPAPGPQSLPKVSADSPANPPLGSSPSPWHAQQPIVVPMEQTAIPSEPPSVTPLARPATSDSIDTLTVAGSADQLRELRKSLHDVVIFDVRVGGVIGRHETAEFRLDHPNVSRGHARIRVRDGVHTIQDLASANGTFVNGRKVSKLTRLEVGDKIDVGPYSLVFDGRNLASNSRSNNVELAARVLKRVVTDRVTGRPLTLLHNISLVVRPREFVCLLGPSGSGKSTLLQMLAGRAAPNGGAVLVNGQDLYANFDALKQDIAVVPQRDVLHDTLPVGKALRYTAELRLPPDTTGRELADSVADMLLTVGLTKRAGNLIRHLSGGQLKRASLANELMSRPSLLFLDEVTSGLDEQTDRDMMKLFRQIADEGKTVVCITHNLANVEATCHFVVILTEGGRLAFFGRPDEARAYFGIERLGDVYEKLKSRSAEDWQASFKKTTQFQGYIRARLPEYDLDGDEDTTASARSERRRANPIRQTSVLTRRYTSVWRGDILALGAMFGQALLVAVLLGIVFGDLNALSDPIGKAQRTANLLFLLNVSCFWLGCNNAAKELVRERIIYERERDFNLRLDSYLSSKYLVLMSIGLAQSAVLLCITETWCRPDGAFLSKAVTLAVLMAAGTALGLAISAWSPTEEVASALVPVAVIPQIILAGVIAPLTGLGKALGMGLITCFWGRRALESLMSADHLAVLERDSQKLVPQLLVIAGHAVVFLTAAVAAMLIRGRRKS